MKVVLNCLMKTTMRTTQSRLRSIEFAFSFEAIDVAFSRYLFRKCLRGPINRVYGRIWLADSAQTWDRYKLFISK